MNNCADCTSICPVSRGRVLTVELPKLRNFCPRPDRCRRQRGQFSDTLSRSQAGRDSSLTVSEGEGIFQLWRNQLPTEDVAESDILSHLDRRLP